MLQGLACLHEVCHYGTMMLGDVMVILSLPCRVPGIGNMYPTHHTALIQHHQTSMWWANWKNISKVRNFYLATLSRPRASSDFKRILSQVLGKSHHTLLWPVPVEVKQICGGEEEEEGDREGEEREGEGGGEEEKEEEEEEEAWSYNLTEHTDSPMQKTSQLKLLWETVTISFENHST